MTSESESRRELIGLCDLILELKSIWPEYGTPLGMVPWDRLESLTGRLFAFAEEFKKETK